MAEMHTLANTGAQAIKQDALLASVSLPLAALLPDRDHAAWRVKRRRSERTFSIDHSSGGSAQFEHR
jgi:hypothetical protein